MNKLPYQVEAELLKVLQRTMIGVVAVITCHSEREDVNDAKNKVSFAYVQRGN